MKSVEKRRWSQSRASPQIVHQCGSLCQQLDISQGTDRMNGEASKPLHSYKRCSDLETHTALLVPEAVDHQPSARYEQGLPWICADRVRPRSSSDSVSRLYFDPTLTGSATAAFRMLSGIRRRCWS